MFYYSDILIYINALFCNIVLDLEAQSGYGE